MRGSELYKSLIFRVMQVADVGKWHQLPGKTIRVKQENGLISAIGHIVKDDWFSPFDDFSALRKRSNG